ncbi:MAG: metal-dependent transcriptional regulator [Methanomicrobiales archaeon]|nr:metal-dependent transcriptional regulator [Methanomicrobiales archaeon]MDD1669115.1 metal-dependent transcriptional regulator [Methanomicrobiales archaeon]
MEPQDGLGLSPRKVEYLKYVFETGGRVKTTSIASRFGVDPSTVTKAIDELARSGLLVHEPYHGVTFSDRGRVCAEFLVKRHRILALVLTRFGLPEEEACREVSRFESLVSRHAVDRICQAMGHPSQGICGEITHGTCGLGREGAGLGGTP